VQQIQQDFQALIAYVTGPETGTASAYTVEVTLFRRLLALGAALLRVFFLTRAAERPAGPVHAPDGAALGYHDCRPCTYYSVFGTVRFARHYFTAVGQKGVCPLDADLSLPARCYSDLLQEWGTYGTTDASYHESHAALEHILQLAVGSAALETMVVDAVVDVEEFHTQPLSAAVRAADGPILVVQADGKGVPMVQPPAGARPVRLGKGQKRTKKKEAVVTSLYTIAPYVRTPQEVVAALLQDRDRPPETAPRPAPVGKELRATLAGKKVALTRLAARARQREGPHIQERVALTDGAEALQKQIETHFPRHTLVLDIIHATDYLWNAANALLGETHPGRPAWIHTQLEQLLAGETYAVITALEAAAQDPARTATQRSALLRTAGYYRRNAPYMRYDAYLARGWPVGTGVVEGACGHLVKDRMEQAGMRWTKAGAQAVLDLRALRLNGQWDAYAAFHRQRQHERLYGTARPVPETAEMWVLADAA
ncbi:MAG: ISKra4 family transposase, partial [Chloroflexi bacterium]|nr:ISKra4 family transposase [Chloroflexota bacterium]